MAKQVKKLVATLEQIDFDIIDQHNAELANPGRSAALRHIIREWARENGHAVSDRGRIAASVIEAYEKAH